MKKNKENMDLKKTELKKKYGNTLVRGVPASFVSSILKKTWTPVEEAEFVVRTPMAVHHTPLLMSLNVSMESRFRFEAELDPEFKQIIPYVVVMHDNKIWCTHRLNGGDARLQGCYSIGTGGHIDDGERIRDAMMRELNEEIGIVDADYIGSVLKGYILDNSSAVNSVHLGVVYVLNINREDIECLEKEKLAGEWITVQQLNDLYNDGKLESWSMLVANKLFFER